MQHRLLTLIIIICACLVSACGNKPLQLQLPETDTQTTNSTQIEGQ
jgi:predicted small lipoprotein YifL